MKAKKQFVNKHEHVDFLTNALTLKGSVTPKVFSKVLVIIAYSILISLLHHFKPSISLPIGPFEYAGLFMGLILVFRVNAGYDRWWEARKIWGSVVNQSRNLSIIVLNYQKIKSGSWGLRVTNYVAAMPYLMKNHLRGDNSLSEVKHLIDDLSFEILKKSSHKPCALSSIIAFELNIARERAELDSFAFLKAEENRALIMDCQGACERILKTPMPFVMAVKSRSFIFLFLLALPFAIVELSIFISPMISGLVAYALFSLDQIGVELQNPFSEERLSHLPLNDICENIEKNIRELQANVL